MDTVSIQSRLEYMDNKFCEALENYRNQSIQEGISSENLLEIMFAMLDRWVGE